jgi:general secretion pathway protein N
MRASSFAALGLAAYSVFLIATIPAAYVAGQANAAPRRQVEVSDAQGTLWNGSAQVRIAPTKGGKAIDRVEWRILPARLFAGELAFHVNAAGEGLSASAQVSRGFSSWKLRELKAAGDAAGVAAYVPLLATWRPSGPVTVTAPEITITGRSLRGSLEAEWRNAVSGLSEVKPLGSYRAGWRANADTGDISVTTLQGPLRLAGVGKTTATGMTFNGEARGEGEAAKALEPLLDLMGPRRPDGGRALELRLE